MTIKYKRDENNCFQIKKINCEKQQDKLGSYSKFARAPLNHHTRQKTFLMII